MHLGRCCLLPDILQCTLVHLVLAVDDLLHLEVNANGRLGRFFLGQVEVFDLVLREETDDYGSSGGGPTAAGN